MTDHPMLNRRCLIRTLLARGCISAPSSRLTWIQVHLGDALRLWQWEDGGLSLSDGRDEWNQIWRQNRTYEVYLTAADRIHSDIRRRWQALSGLSRIKEAPIWLRWRRWLLAPAGGYGWGIRLRRRLRLGATAGASGSGLGGLRLGLRQAQAGGSGFGKGDGSELRASGSGDGPGDGSGDGSGCGSGDGSGDGSGCGSGDDDGSDRSD